MIFAQSTLVVRLLVISFVQIMLMMYWYSKALNWYWHVESPLNPPAVFKSFAITATKSRWWIADVYSGRSYKSYCEHSTPVSTALTHSHNQKSIPERALWCSPPALSRNAHLLCECSRPHRLAHVPTVPCLTSYYQSEVASTGSPSTWAPADWNEHHNCPCPKDRSFVHTMSAFPVLFTNPVCSRGVHLQHGPPRGMLKARTFYQRQ